MLVDALSQFAAGYEQQACHVSERGSERLWRRIISPSYVDTPRGEPLGLFGVADDGDELVWRNDLEQALEHEAAEISGCTGDCDHLCLHRVECC
jgi:hypothetical protein